MAINKVQYGNTTLIDLTDTTATAADVMQGTYFYDRGGVRVEGALTPSGGAGIFKDAEGFIVLPSTERGVISDGYGWYDTASIMSRGSTSTSQTLVLVSGTYLPTNELLEPKMAHWVTLTLTTASASSHRIKSIWWDGYSVKAYALKGSQTTASSWENISSYVSVSKTFVEEDGHKYWYLWFTAAEGYVFYLPTTEVDDYVVWWG